MVEALCYSTLIIDLAFIVETMKSPLENYGLGETIYNPLLFRYFKIENVLSKFLILNRPNLKNIQLVLNYRGQQEVHFHNPGNQQASLGNPRLICCYGYNYFFLSKRCLLTMSGLVHSVFRYQSIPNSALYLFVYFFLKQE